LAAHNALRGRMAEMSERDFSCFLKHLKHVLTYPTQRAKFASWPRCLKTFPDRRLDVNLFELILLVNINSSQMVVGPILLTTR
jgi:hypothetical protein